MLPTVALGGLYQWPNIAATWPPSYPPNVPNKGYAKTSNDIAFTDHYYTDPVDVKYYKTVNMPWI